MGVPGLAPTLSIPHWLESCSFQLSRQLSLQGQMSVGVVGSPAARTPDVCGNSGSLYTHSSHSFPGNCLGSGMSPGAWEPNVGFPASSPFNPGSVSSLHLLSITSFPIFIIERYFTIFSFFFLFYFIFETESHCVAQAGVQ